MAGHDFDALFRGLKAGEIANAYYLHGAEHRLKDESVRAILDRVLDPGLRDFNLDNRSAASLAPEDVHALCTTLPMMAERRVVVIRDVEGWNKRAKGKATMAAYLARPAPETVVILVQGDEGGADSDLAPHCYVVECARLAPARAARWLVREANALDVDIAPEAIDHLVRVADSDLGVLSSELGKLAGFSGEGPVTLARVEALVGVRHGETQFDWRDAVMDQRPADAARLLGPLLDQPGISGVRLLMVLAQTLLGVGVARALYDDGRRGSGLEREMFNVIRRSRLWGIDYRETARAWSGWAAQWAGDRVRLALRDALRADQALKSTTVSDERGILLDLVMALAPARREAA